MLRAAHFTAQETETRLAHAPAHGEEAAEPRGQQAGAWPWWGGGRSPLWRPLLSWPRAGGRLAQRPFRPLPRHSILSSVPRGTRRETSPGCGCQFSPGRRCDPGSLLRGRAEAGHQHLPQCPRWDLPEGTFSSFRVDRSAHIPRPTRESPSGQPENRPRGSGRGGGPHLPPWACQVLLSLLTSPCPAGAAPLQPPLHPGLLSEPPSPGDQRPLSTSCHPGPSAFSSLQVPLSQSQPWTPTTTTSVTRSAHPTAFGRDRTRDESAHELGEGRRSPETSPLSSVLF